MISLPSLLLLFWQTLAAIFLAVGFTYLAFALARLLLPAPASPSNLWPGVIATGIWLLTVVFHLLAALGIFKLGAALAVVLAGGIVTHMRGYPLRQFTVDFSKAVRPFTRIPAWLNPWPLRALAALQTLAAVGTSVRVLLLPALGWDSLTYHTPKAAFWVQTGGYDLLQTPGSWGYYYRHLFGGGEVFTAWAMLPFHSDLFTSLVDITQWGALGLVLFSLGKTIGLSPRTSWLGGSYMLFLPAIWLAVGSGYVDTGLLLAILLGVLFAAQYVQTRHIPLLVLCGMSLGVAVGIKIVAAPTAALLILAVLISTFTRQKQSLAMRYFGMWGAAGILAVLLPVLPWLVLNWARTGTILGVLPVEIGPLVLGEASPTIAWYQAHPELKSTGVVDEIIALARMFRSPFTSTPHLGIFTLVSVIIFPLALWRLSKHKMWEARLLAGVAIGTLLAFYQPGFQVIRLQWPLVTGRFLLPLVAAATLGSLAWSRGSSSAHGWFLGLGSALHIIGSAFYGWASFEYAAVFLWIILFGLLVFFTWRFARKVRSPGFRVFFLVSLVLLVTPVLSAYRDTTRYTAAALSTIYDPAHKYWLPAAYAVDGSGPGVKIAITSGPDQNADNWFMAFFLGTRLQNQLVYVPVTQDGSIPDFDPEYSLALRVDPTAWLARLVDQNVDYVMSYGPASVELGWMENDPGRFTRVFGDRNIWGLYRLQP